MKPLTYSRFTLFFLTAILSLSIIASCTGPGDGSKFYTTENGTFIAPATKQQPAHTYYYIGTNFWYGAILASDTEYADHERLSAELDSLKALGLTNLRVLVGGDGPKGIPSQIEPSLQTEAGVYDENVFRGLDRLLAELNKRGMTAVLYLNNAWEWSGGYARYLEWAGESELILPSTHGWDAYGKNAAKFITSDKAKALFAKHVETVISRTNTITGVPYKDDPAIFSWQIANEPRCFSDDPAVKQAFAQWLHETASQIKALDPNHMVSTGSEGSWGCQMDMDLFEAIHACPDIDYMTIHIWPYNWSWVREDSLESNLPQAIANTDEYIDSHIAVAEKYRKPLVIEEFGFPRDGFRFEKGSATLSRDAYYGHIIRRVIESKKDCGVLAGLNFWGWGGLAQQAAEQWRPGDDYCGDPAQEQQGLNSVYLTDTTTLELIQESVAELDSISGIHAEAILENDWMYQSGKASRLRVAVRTISSDNAPERTLALTLLTDKGEAVMSTVKKLGKNSGADTVDFKLRLEPGFYKVILSVESADAQKDTSADEQKPILVQSFNIGCEPENIVSEQDKQLDFDEFWEESLAELARVAPEYKLTLIPERSNDIRRTYHVQMYSFGGEMISGVLLEPVKEGKYPVFINYMGYGSDVWYNDPSARPEAIEFTLCVRNQALNRLEGEKDDWCVRGLGSEYTYYYRGAFMDVIRAIDFVESLDKADTAKIFAEGGSQGGAFTLVSASLDNRIKGIAPFVPFLSDFPDYFQIVNWPAQPIIDEAARLGLPDEELYRILSYFDIKNLADRITCPVLMGFGLQDGVCPPHTNFSGYNMISSPKRYITFPLSGHHVERESLWWQERDKFFNELVSNDI